MEFSIYQNGFEIKNENKFISNNENQYKIYNLKENKKLFKITKNKKV